MFHVRYSFRADIPGRFVSSFSHEAHDTPPRGFLVKRASSASWDSEVAKQCSQTFRTYCISFEETCISSMRTIRFVSSPSPNFFVNAAITLSSSLYILPKEVGEGKNVRGRRGRF